MLTINPNVVPKNQQQYKSKITFKGQINRQITPNVQPKLSQTSKKALNILKNMYNWSVEMEKVGHKMENPSDFIKNFPF